MPAQALGRPSDEAPQPTPADRSARALAGPLNWLPVVSAVALIASLFLPWYSLAIPTNGSAVSIGLASTAPQWMRVTPWIVVLVAVAVIVYATAPASRSQLHRSVLAVPRELTLIGPSVAVMLIVYRILQPPSLPGSSSEYSLQGTPTAGPYVALFLALMMTATVYAQARRRAAS